MIGSWVAGVMTRFAPGVGDDVVAGGPGKDLIDGAAGHDVLRGGQGEDELFGGSGNDLLDGRAASDRLHGEDGNDRLFGRRGSDELIGGAGDDRLIGHGGDDVLVGGAGTDILRGVGGVDHCFGATAAISCEWDTLDVAFKVTNRQTIRNLGVGPGPGYRYSAESVVTVRVWDQSRTALLREPVEVRTNSRGVWSVDLVDPVPLGSYVEVTDDRTGFVSDLQITIQVDSVNVDRGRIKGPLFGSGEMWASLEPVIRADSVDRFDDAFIGRAGNNWLVRFRRLGDFPQVVRLGRHDDGVNGRVPQEEIEFAVELPKPTVAIDQLELSGQPGHWTPGALVDINVDGKRRDSVRVAADGTFQYSFGDQLLRPGSQLDVAERGGGARTQVHYVSGIDSAIRRDSHIRLYLGNLNRPAELTVFGKDGSEEVFSPTGQSSFIFSAENFAFGYLRYDTPEGHLVGEYFLFDFS